MRQYCPSCGYPQSTCLCKFIELRHAPVNIIILQHHKETGHAKNTARLVSLGLSNTTIISGKSSDDFAHLTQRVSISNSALIYPGDNSQPIESPSFKTNQPDTLFFLDGSWRQAYALYAMLPWLSILPQWRFTRAAASEYNIRHTNLSEGLSTLEAVVYSLKEGFDFNAAHLLTLQQAMQRTWQAPAHHLRQ